MPRLNQHAKHSTVIATETTPQHRGTLFPLAPTAWGEMGISGASVIPEQTPQLSAEDLSRRNFLSLNSARTTFGDHLHGWNEKLDEEPKFLCLPQNELRVERSSVSEPVSVSGCDTAISSLNICAMKAGL